MHWTVVMLMVLLAAAADGRTKEEWKSRIIYHILTDRFSREGATPAEPCVDLRSWCGGNFRGVQQRLDYIKGLGANAVYISPIVLNTPGGYHGYWAKNIYEFEPHWGTEQDFRDLITAAHEKDIWMMVDVVPNHMGYPYGCTEFACNDTLAVNFTGLTPFDQAEHYHTNCRTDDWDNQTQVEQCRLAYLPDLNQTVPYVRQTLLDWIRNLTSMYNIDGYRVDTVKHIEKSFWPEYQQAGRLFMMGEVWHGDPAYCAPYQRGMDSLFNYPMYYALKDVFVDKAGMNRLSSSLAEQRAHFKDVSVLGTIIDNHDNQRFLNLTTDRMQLKNALAYVIMGQGIPVLYYGTEQEFSGGKDPNNRESLWPHYNTNSTMYQFISRLGNYRLNTPAVQTGPQHEVHADDNSFIFTRGNNSEALIALTNSGTGQTIIRTFPITQGFKNGRVYENVLDPSDQVTLTNCQLTLQNTNGEPKVYKLTYEGTGQDCGESDSAFQASPNLVFLLIQALWTLTL